MSRAHKRSRLTREQLRLIARIEALETLVAKLVAMILLDQCDPQRPPLPTNALSALKELMSDEIEKASPKTLDHEQLSASQFAFLVQEIRAALKMLDRWAIGKIDPAKSSGAGERSGQG